MNVLPFGGSCSQRLNPHLHMIVLDGTWREKDWELAWEGLRPLRPAKWARFEERWNLRARSGSKPLERRLTGP
jgi:hypothetical protein